MNSFFDLDNPVFRFLGRIFDIAHLNVLCLICCIPIITIGPSVTALYYCMLKIARKSDTTISQMFFHSFKENLKQGMLLTVFFAVAAFILIFDIRVCLSSDNVFLEHINSFLYVLFIVLASIISYAFPLLAQFENNTKNILKYSFLLAISNFGYTAIILVFNAIPFVIFFLLPELFLVSFLIWIFFGFAAIAFLNSRLFVKIFDKFIPET